MEDRVVAGVNLVSSVAVPSSQERGVPRPHQLRLVRGRVRPQAVVLVEVERVADGAADVVGRHQDFIKTHRRRDLRVHVVEDLKLRLSAGELERFQEVVVDAFFDDVDRVVLLQVQVAADPGLDMRRDVALELARRGREEAAHTRAPAAGDDAGRVLQLWGSRGWEGHFLFTL